MAENSSHAANNVNEFNKFLNNNTGFIHEKYDLHFDGSLSISTLTTADNNERCLKFIYDIFSFQKYESNPKLNNTLRKGLTANIEAFVQESQKKDVREFSRDTAVNLLKYCIENNDMFAVHYDRKNPKKRSEQVQEERVVQKHEVKEEKREELKEVAKVEEEVVKEEEKQVEQVQEAEPEPEPQQQITQQKNEVKEQVLDELGSNEFQNPIPAKTKEENLDLIHRQLRSIFEFYCKQQQNVTPNSTFDLINHKCQTMNLGKFLYFAVAANIVQTREKAYSEARIDKKAAIAIFKRFAEGQREIQVKVFLAIMDELHRNDENIYARMGLGQEGAKGKTKIIENLKYFNLPFNTRDPTGREKSPHGKVFIPKLTTHSGKAEQSLREELLLRKERLANVETGDRLRAESKTVFRNKAQPKAAVYSTEEPKQTTKFTLKLGQANQQTEESQNLKFLSKLITHQDNDQLFLKDYYLPNKKHTNSAKDKGRTGIMQQSIRYAKPQQDLTQIDRSFKSPGDYTSRPREALVLPLIKQKKNQGMLTQRRSLGVEKKVAYKL